MVMLSAADYERLVEAAEDLRDIEIGERRIRAIESGESEYLTSEEAKELLAAKSPLAFWRKKRGLTQGALSKASGVAQGFISEIEAGNKPGGAATLKKLAAVLKLTVDDLV
ncbi:helix-turn-helix domain-containing protein [Bradyrhizobium oligotrophicum]|uniref:helix-turn-helix domain-containing protein n=1 Tax=Bradyrhizobium oligotrophicum TaxID=44255 RepID=UPI003EBDDB2B